ncbi:MAG: NAD(P)/FAD-dependent oxidoreductase [Acidimicrobiia bacterium]|nr:NAD(P)/FAD-dependent oxidoreductase [Acidimicrobiia bacterium]
MLGAGPAGLGAAYRLARAGRSVVVLERADEPGGLAGSFEVAGVRVDHGSHRLHPACPPPVLETLRELLGPGLRRRPRRGASGWRGAGWRSRPGWATSPATSRRASAPAWLPTSWPPRSGLLAATASPTWPGPGSARRSPSTCTCRSPARSGGSIPRSSTGSSPGAGSVPARRPSSSAGSARDGAIGAGSGTRRGASAASSSGWRRRPWRPGRSCAWVPRCAPSSWGRRSRSWRPGACRSGPVRCGRRSRSRSCPPSCPRRPPRPRWSRRRGRCGTGRWCSCTWSSSSPATRPSTRTTCRARRRRAAGCRSRGTTAREATTPGPDRAVRRGAL